MKTFNREQSISRRDRWTGRDCWIDFSGQTLIGKITTHSDGYANIESVGHPFLCVMVPWCEVEMSMLGEETFTI